MFNSSILLRGTFILTASSILTRFMGFFYRIFLSRIFTSKEIGLYQIIFPLYTLGFSFAASGIQTVLSRSTARYLTQNNKAKAIHTLKCALALSSVLSFIYIFSVQTNLSSLSNFVFHDSRCENMLLVMTYALPFAVIHSGICGYYIGQRHPKPVAISQLIEQFSRIIFIILLYLVLYCQGQNFSITYAVLGLIIGELAACIYTIMQIKNKFITYHVPIKNILPITFDISKDAIPLTFSRVFINAIQSFEAISIPIKLQMSGLSDTSALGLYGIFSGMALPCILFPSALTNALSAMLLPTIASFQISQEKKKLQIYIYKITVSCFLLGSLCFLLFLGFGKYIGYFIFRNLHAGIFIQQLSFLCPFLYVNTLLLSILNGLGYPLSTFFINICSLSVRLMTVYHLIPKYGFSGYLFGLFSSQLIISILTIIKIIRTISK